MGIDADLEPETVEEVKKTIAELPISMVDGGLAGKELMDITHLNSKAIVKLNSSHPFISEVYERPARCLASCPRTWIRWRCSDDPKGLERLGGALHGVSQG